MRPSDRHRHPSVRVRCGCVLACAGRANVASVNSPSPKQRECKGARNGMQIFCQPQSHRPALTLGKRIGPSGQEVGDLAGAVGKVVRRETDQFSLR
jgi:hypothetical protein